MFGSGARFVVPGAAGIDTPVSLAGTILQGTIVIEGAFLNGAGPTASPPDSGSALMIEAARALEAGNSPNQSLSLRDEEDFRPGDPDRMKRAPPG